MKPLLISGLLLLVVACQSTTDNYSSKLPELNGQWQFQVSQAELDDLDPVAANFDASSWDRIAVPGNWYPQGFDVAGKHWYRRQFELLQRPNTDTILSFEGVDYKAQVWLNGQFIGSHEGYFSRFEFNVSEQLKPGTNTLAVRVDSPLEHQQDASWSLHKRLIKGVLSHHDTRPGGAWGERGQERNTGGIWGSVSLRPAPKVAVSGLQWRSELSGGLAQGQLQFSASSEQVESWRVTLDGIGFDERHQFELTGQLGQARQTLQLPWQPWRLWWPREYGDANQYRLTLEAKYGGGYQRLKTMTVGFRQVDYDGQLGQWYINQKRVFLRGTNYIPSLYMAEVDEYLIRRDLALMVDANINIVRVHAMVLPQRFYQIANELGMMVWQDFPLQWGYVDDAAFRQQATEQMAAMLNQFGHHSSIVAWAAHNEPPWDADWMQWKYPDYQPQQNKQLDLALFATIKEIDRSRPAFVASLTKEHPWLGWYSGSWRDYGKPTEQSLITEFGAQALPDLPVWASVVSVADDLALPSDYAQWEFHNFQPKESFEIAGIEPGNNVMELIDNTQRYQSRLVRYAAESLRRQKYQPVGGIFQFMMVEHWPSANWGVVDFQRNPKPGYQALQLAYQPVMPSIMHDQHRFADDVPVALPVYLLNDLHQHYPNAYLQLQLHQGQTLIVSRELNVSLAEDSVQQLASFPEQPLPEGQYRFLAKLYDGKRQLLGESHFDFEVSND